MIHACLDSKKKGEDRLKEKKEIFHSLAMVTQVGISMLAPVILCVALGFWMEQKFGWYTTIPLLILGILSGTRNTWILLRQVIKEEEKEKKNEKNE